ncbi:4Fe-4S binding protein [Psychrilyobacter atlanticus]|uniref:4Fe-4S binding protein n=1 Tax=Psychrilyobacter atlanticus TaxID=271091 RepID=UPI00041B23F8|nr:4Fe-4S binding protein [Psychrilyobacter atlanticus]
MKIKEIYELFDRIGVLTFSTIHNNEVHSRVAHFNGCDEEGIYFRTMWNKPFARQLMETGKITVCGISDTKILSHDGDLGAEFPPGYSVRLIGEVKFISEEEIREKAKTNKELKLAVYDMDKYSAMKKGNFMIHKAKVEIFDYDFSCKNRDHKLLRTRMAFGGMTYNEAGPTITDKCIQCGLCYKKCSFKAIEKGSSYSVISERCDDCGDCISVCPVDAIELSSPF